MNNELNPEEIPLQIYLLVPVLSIYLLNIYYMPGTVVGAGNMEVNKSSLLS